MRSSKMEPSLAERPSARARPSAFAPLRPRVVRAFARAVMLMASLTLAFWLSGCRRGATEPAAPRADVELFTREGCGRCDAAKAWLMTFHGQRPAVTLEVTDVGARPEGLARLRAVAEHAGGAAVSVPAFWVRGTLVVGFAGPSTGARIEGLLAGVETKGPASHEDATCPVEPDVPCEDTAAGASVGASAGANAADAITLPGLGTMRVRDLGLPLFTIAVGLVDGVNPCAMWVLLFLLSFLASLGSRTKMLLIAVEFVLVSALAYYAFMAAWVTVFSLVGLSRAVQVALALLGLFVGAVNVKDFFAFHEGLTFSIPEGAKPGLYRRMRAVVRAETLPLALLAAAVLAVMVNVVELLCTAGLPALYTQVLASQHLPPWQRYAYLALYDVAYMLDDMIMVGIAVVTLGHHKLQERGGRWLKLLSGVVMVTLAMLLLVRPGWLTL